MRSSFCPASSLWLFASGRSANWGALFLRLLRAFWSAEGRSRRFRYLLIPLLFIFSPLVALGGYLVAEQSTAYSADEFLNALSLIYLLVFALPLTARLSLTTRRGFFNRMLQFDFFSTLVVIAIGLWHSLYLNSFESWVLWGGFLWILQALRIIEAWLTAKSIPPLQSFSISQNEILLQSTQTAKELERKELGLGISAFLLVLVTFLLATYFPQTEVTPELSLAVLFFLLPFHHLVFSKLFIEAISHRTHLPQFKSLMEIQKIRAIRSHHAGVFSKPLVEYADHWVDPSAAWSDQEIEDLISALSQDVTHPHCQALQLRFAKSRHKLKVADIEYLPYQGIRVQTRNAEGQSLDIRLGSLNWFIAEGHDLNPEGQRLIDSWIKEQKPTSFLSINRRIVAAFCFTQESKGEAKSLFDQLKSQSRPIALLSSSPREQVLSHSTEFAEISANLLPLEREIQLEHWRERAKEFIELRASWDPPPPDAAYPIVFCRSHEIVGVRKEVLIFDESLKAAEWLFRTAESYQSRLRMCWIQPVGLALAGALTISLGLSVFSILALLLPYYYWMSAQR